MTQNSIGDVVGWLDRQGETHFGGAARVYKAALMRLAERRVEREPETIEWVNDNLEILAQRLAKAENVAPNSLRTYMSRARSALSAYTDWLQNPVGWSPTKKGTVNGNAPTKRGGKVKTKPPKDAQPPPAPSTSTAERTLQDEISEALVAIARWPRLRPFLMKGLTEAMTTSEK